MTETSTQVTFRSAAFPAVPEEAEMVNPGRHGMTLAYWIQEQLEARGAPAAEPIPEDWGWMVELREPGVRAFVGCGNVDDDEGAFMCFVEQAGRGLRRRTTPEGDAAVRRAATALDDALRSHPAITDIVWVDADDAAT